MNYFKQFQRGLAANFRLNLKFKFFFEYLNAGNKFFYRKLLQFCFVRSKNENFKMPKPFSVF